MRGQRVHVASPTALGRVICSRPAKGLEIVPLHEASHVPAACLCQKCRQQIKRYELGEVERLAPHPGLQHEFPWVYDYE